MDQQLLATQRDETAYPPSRIPHGTAALDPLISSRRIGIRLCRRTTQARAPGGEAGGLAVLACTRKSGAPVSYEYDDRVAISSLALFRGKTFVFNSNELCAFVGLGLGLAHDVHYISI